MLLLYVAVGAATCRRLLERGRTSEGRNGSACNLWAFCGDKEKCKTRFGECWLKRDKALKPQRQHLHSKSCIVHMACCCCAAAAVTRRRLLERGGTSEGRNGSACNLWAFCGDKEKCKTRFGECWLKRDKALKPPPALPERAQKSEGWISGAVYENDTHVSGLQCFMAYCAISMLPYLYVHCMMQLT
jgi:hypothetical protein